MRDKVAIVGFTQHGVQAPWKNPAWDKWGLNDLHGMFEAMQPGIFGTDQVQWFQLHHKDPTGRYPGARDEQHTEWLLKQTCPVWMWDHHDDIPASRPYPIHEVLTKALLPHGKPLSEESYYNNTISWMIAKAILDGYTTIGLYGVDMALDGVHGESEYSWQRPSVEYFVGVARGLGINVVIPAESEICKSGFLYGWDNRTWSRVKFTDRLNQLEAQEQECIAHYEQVKREVFELKGQLWGVGRELSLIQALQANAPDAAQLEPIAKIIADNLQAQKEGQQNEVLGTNELEAAKRRLHECRGAKNDLLWVIRNYLPGDGAIQDVERTPRSITAQSLDSVSEPQPSDGTAPKNRLAGVLL